MDWFNYHGRDHVPNIVFAVKNKNDGSNAHNNKVAETFEQIGRYGCMAFIVFNIPYTYSNFWLENGLMVYLIVNGVLCFGYVLFWIICWEKNNLLEALSLSVLPSMIFLFSGIMLGGIPLLAFSVIFAIFHIFISLKNAERK